MACSGLLLLCTTYSATAYMLEVHWLDHLHSYMAWYHALKAPPRPAVTEHNHSAMLCAVSTFCIQRSVQTAVYSMPCCCRLLTGHCSRTSGSASGSASLCSETSTSAPSTGKPCFSTLSSFGTQHVATHTRIQALAAVPSDVLPTG